MKQSQTGFIEIDITPWMMRADTVSVPGSTQFDPIREIDGCRGNVQCGKAS